jgi:hypothetical protein
MLGRHLLNGQRTGAHSMQRIVLFGAGGIGRSVAGKLLASGITPLALADNDPKKHGTSVQGVPVLSVEEAARKFPDARAIVTIYDAAPRQAMTAQLAGLKRSSEWFENFLREHGLSLNFMTDREIAWLDRTARTLKPEDQWVEVGTWKGNSFAVVSRAVPDGCTVWAVDTWNAGADPKAGDDSVFEVWLAKLAELRQERPRVRMDFHRLLSVEAAPRFADRSLRAIFIDADHTEEGVYSDLVAWWPKLKPGGIFAGHDLSAEWPGVERALKRFTAPLGKSFRAAADSIWVMDT